MAAVPIGHGKVLDLFPVGRILPVSLGAGGNGDLHRRCRQIRAGPAGEAVVSLGWLGQGNVGTVFGIGLRSAGHGAANQSIFDMVRGDQPIQLENIEAVNAI